MIQKAYVITCKPTCRSSARCSTKLEIPMSWPPRRNTLSSRFCPPCTTPAPRNPSCTLQPRWSCGATHQSREEEDPMASRWLGGAATSTTAAWACCELFAGKQQSRAGRARTENLVGRGRRKIQQLHAGSVELLPRPRPHELAANFSRVENKAAWWWGHAENLVDWKRSRA
jgi:hypothetical protein